MEASEKVAAYYAKERPFKNEIATLRTLMRSTELEETYKWNFPVYALNNKNVVSICSFKHHFGIWFFNGSFLKDPLKILENAQEGKTKAMRHWKFRSKDEIDLSAIKDYVLEAIENQKKDLVLKPQKKSKKEITVPKELTIALAENQKFKDAFNALSPFKQREYYEYIATAKQDKTKQSRIAKILPMVLEGIGLNDAYR